MYKLFYDNKEKTYKIVDLEKPKLVRDVQIALSHGTQEESWLLMPIAAQGECFLNFYKNGEKDFYINFELHTGKINFIEDVNSKRLEEITIPKDHQSVQLLRVRNRVGLNFTIRPLQYGIEE